MVNEETNLLRTIFKEAYVTTATIGSGNTSAIIYVPKQFKNKKATVIIWNDKPTEENNGSGN